MIAVVACLFAAAVVLLTVSAYAAGRADGWIAGTEAARRDHREELSRRNLAINKQYIDHVIRKGKA